MSPEIVGLSILILGVSLIAGKLVRIHFTVFSRYFLPSSVIAGFILLIAGPEVLGQLTGFVGWLPDTGYGLLNEEIVGVFRILPGLLISVIFAALFLGKEIPGMKDIWMIAGPQVSFGQTVAWGQYVLGLTLGVLILSPFFGANPMAGALIEIAFEGGHGTSSGLAATFEEVGFEEGLDLALGLATVGVVSGVILGVILINWAVRRNKANYIQDPADFDENQLRGVIEEEEREAGGIITTSTQSIEPLALHFGMLAVAILIGRGILELLLMLEKATWGAGNDLVIVGYLPLFPLAMLGGVILQLFLEHYDHFGLVDRKMIKRIQGLALDILIVAAIASLSLQVIGENIWVFILLAATGIIWNVFAFIMLAPRMIPQNWFERGIGDFGQSMGMTAAGLMLIRIADSEGKTKALEAFGYKQLMFEPFVGGGLMTVLSIPLIYQFGAVNILFFSLIVMLVWLFTGIFYFGRKDAADGGEGDGSEADGSEADADRPKKD